jgi:hypothetical protein
MILTKLLKYRIKGYPKDNVYDWKQKPKHVQAGKASIANVRKDL